MRKVLCSTNDGRIVLVNESEVDKRLGISGDLDCILNPMLTFDVIVTNGFETIKRSNVNTNQITEMIRDGYEVR